MGPYFRLTTMIFFTEGKVSWEVKEIREGVGGVWGWLALRGGGNLLIKYMHHRGRWSLPIEGDSLLVLFDTALLKQSWVVDIWAEHGVLSSCLLAFRETLVVESCEWYVFFLQCLLLVVL